MLSTVPTVTSVSRPSLHWTRCCDPSRPRRGRNPEPFEGSKMRATITSHRMKLVLNAIATLLLLAAAAGPAFALSVPVESGLKLVPVASGLLNPVYCTAPPGDDRLFIVEQLGRVRILRGG